MPSAFSQCLKALSNEVLDLGEEATPDASRKRRGGSSKQDAKATPAKKLRESQEDETRAEAKVKKVAANEPLQSTASRAELATREEPDSPPEKNAKGKAKAKAARRKKSEVNVEGGDQTAEPKKVRKPKPEGPYTKFKEDSMIPEASILRKELPPGAESFKAVSWNLGGLRGFFKNRPDALAELAKREQPDMIGLLEHKLQEGAPDTLSTMAALLETLPDYESVEVHCSTVKKGYSGTLVLLRKDSPKPVSMQQLDLPSAKGEGRLILVEFEKHIVLLAYVPNSGEGLKRLDERLGQWDVQLREKLQELAARKPTMLLGDLNVAHRDEDIWNAEAPHIPKSAGTTAEERESFSKLLEAGFVDGFAHMHPEALGAFTYWSVRAGNRPKNRGLRLDYAVTSRSLVSADAPKPGTPTLVDVFHLVDMSTGDHCPVGAVLSL